MNHKKVDRARFELATSTMPKYNLWGNNIFLIVFRRKLTILTDFSQHHMNEIRRKNLKKLNFRA